jgi:hypothetical protein
VSDVVEIDVHGEPRQAQVEQVESGAAFQNESSAEEGVFLELGEEFAQSEDFLEVVGLKACGFAAAGKLDGSNFMLVCAVSPAARALPVP